MLDIVLLTIGKIKESYYSEAASEYLKRLKPYARICLEELKAESFSESNRTAAKRIEGERIKNFLERYHGADIWLLDEAGQEFDSLLFSAKLDKLPGKIVFVLAGSLGWDKELFEGYKRFSLSKLTFPHELARVVLLEQLYRAATIISGKTYHY